ncbi:MAG: glycosyltransferase [Fibrobacterales bacterium]
MNYSIPNRLIFIWFGNSFPLANQLAIKSAIDKCKPEETLLIQEGLSMETEGIAELVNTYGVTLMDADSSWFNDLPPGGETALQLFNTLTSPASRANLLRMASLYKLGGIYLDMDTITTKSLDPLRTLDGFIGTETVALPGSLFHSKNPFRWLTAGIRMAAREFCVRIPYGYQLFKLIEPLYHQAVNNAVIGSAPKNPIWVTALNTIEQMPQDERLKRFRLGTHLMQGLTGNRSIPNMTVFNFRHFYPLGPEISAFWFKPGYAKQIHSMVRDETYLIHWYNSVEKRFLKQTIDRAFLDNHQNTPFYALVKTYL